MKLEEELIISEEQAHSFALAIFNDIRNYFLDLENYISFLLKFSANAIQNNVTDDDIKKPIP